MIILTPENPIEKVTQPSIFLAGPSPRDDTVVSWRPFAFSDLVSMGFDGMIFSPEPWADSWEKQVEWEEYYLENASCILFWVPRNLKTMPAFTTNIEWGAWCKSGKVVFGAPNFASNIRYMKYYADKYHIPRAEFLADTIKLAIDMTRRKDGCKNL